ncbi:MAG: hypothetical protein ACPGQL_09570 [Thermoplasmatota archaeon]
MYPFERKRDWFLANRSKHLMAAIDRQSDASHREDPWIQKRFTAIRGLLRARLALFIILYFNLVVAGGGWLLRLLPVLDDLERFLSVLASIASSMAVIVPLGIFFLTRLLGIQELNVLSYLLLGRNAPAESPSQSPE